MDEPMDFITIVLLFKLFCIAGLELLVFFYLDWALKHDRKDVISILRGTIKIKSEQEKAAVIRKLALRKAKRTYRRAFRTLRRLIFGLMPHHARV